MFIIIKSRFEYITYANANIFFRFSNKLQKIINNEYTSKNVNQASPRNFNNNKVDVIENKVVVIQMHVTALCNFVEFKD